MTSTHATRRPSGRLTARLAVSVVLAGYALAPALVCAAQDTPKRVLVLYSFGRGQFEDFARGFRGELERLSPQVRLFEVSLETARFAETTAEGPFLEYLKVLVAERRVDLLVAVGGPAAEFCVRHREHLLPSTPRLLAGAERRALQNVPCAKDVVAVPVVLDFTAVVENILRLCPDTTDIVIVLGGTPLSKLWLAESKRMVQPLLHRVRFKWLHGLSLEEMRERVAVLPPHTAILYGEYTDDSGIANAQDRALASLHSVSSAPIFGVFDTQMGHGIVGGPLLSEAESSRQAAATAFRILNGEAPESIETPPVTRSVVVYDFRELERWGIDERLLPAGSTVLFRPPSVWKEYRRPLMLGIGVVGLQTALIGALLLQRSRRRVAQGEARDLARRLLSAHEDERRRLARELHDDLTQRLARLAIDAARVGKSLSATPEEATARAMRDDLVHLSEDVHALSYRLHPSVLDDLGLKEALEVECEQFSRRESIPARLTLFEVPSELAPEVSVCLFRIAQEALRNVARHSGASQVSVSVVAKNSSVRLAVSDDGQGFDLSQQRAHRSLGQASMKERARLVGGKLEVESAPGLGTTVHVSVPLNRGRS